MAVWSATRMTVKPFMLIRLCSMCLLLGVTLSVQAKDDANAWLMKISQAARQLNYQGVFVYQHGQYLDSMQIIHSVDSDNGVRERLVSLNGAPREVIRDNQEVRCYLPDENSVVVEHRKLNEKSFPSLLPEQWHVLEQNYKVSLGKRGRVTDRAAQLVVISPKDKYRYGYQLWAAVDSGLLLEANLINNENRAIERFMFTQIDVGGTIQEASLLPRSAHENLVWHRDTGLSSPDTSSHWQVKNLPRGFALTSHLSRSQTPKAQGQDKSIEHLVFSDGLAAVSVFIEPLSARSQGMQGASDMGAVHAYSTVVGDYQITVVGEVPAATVALIGRSISMQQ